MPQTGSNSGANPADRAYVERNAKPAPRVAVFEDGWEVWLLGTSSRANMRVTIENSKMDANGNWEYKLKDSNGELVEEGKFFPEDQLSNNSD